MIREEALKRAKATPKEERTNEALKQIKQSTKILKDSEKKLEDELKQVDSCFNMLIEQASPQDRVKAAQTVNKVQSLLTKLKQGADVNDIVKQINNLAI